MWYFNETGGKHYCKGKHLDFVKKTHSEKMFRRNFVVGDTAVDEDTAADVIF